nr:hypothetical protein Iba_chr05aCG7730 [Ipomoea batatas]
MLAGSSLSFEQQRIKDKLQELGLTFIQPPPYLSRPEQPLARGTLSISISRFDEPVRTLSLEDITKLLEQPPQLW